MPRQYTIEVDDDFVQFLEDAAKLTGFTHEHILKAMANMGRNTQFDKNEKLDRFMADVRQAAKNHIYRLL